MSHVPNWETDKCDR